MTPLLRCLRSDDLDFANSFSREAGWNQTRPDWERFLCLAPQGCFLAESDGRPAGTATTTAYGNDLAWIGMVLVTKLPKPMASWLAAMVLARFRLKKVV